MEEIIDKLKAENDNLLKLLGLISHDLRSFFTPILGFSSVLYEDYENFSEKERKEYILLLYESTKKIHTLIEESLLFAQAKRKKITPNKKLFSLRTIIREKTECVEKIASAKNIYISHFCDENMKINADPLMLGVVIQNLLTNAVKFTHKNGQIVIVVFERDDKIEIRVKDTGIGMSEEEAQNIFTEKKKCREGTENEPSTGLGLELCSDFVKMHNGTIFATSEGPGTGSVFKITIPKV